MSKLFKMLIMSVTIVLSVSMWSFITNAATVEVPIKNASFEEKTTGDFKALRYDAEDKRTITNPAYSIPGWSLYYTYEPALVAYPDPDAFMLYDSDKTYDKLADAADGSRVMNLVDESKEKALHLWSDPIEVVAGRRYTLSHELYSEATSFFGFIYFDKDGQIIKVDKDLVVSSHPDTIANRTTSYFAKWITCTVNATNKNKWTKFSGYLVPPEGAVTARIAFSKNRTNVHSSSIDNVRLTYEDTSATTPAPTPAPTNPSGISNALSEKISNAVVLFVGKSNAYVNGKKSSVDASNSDVKPIIKDGRTVVPVRFISEAFDAKVEWDEATSKVTITKGGTVISVILGESKLFKNGVEIPLDVAAFTENGRTLLPLRAVVEALDKKVFWEDRGLIVISSNDNIFNNASDKGLIDEIIRVVSK